MCTTCSEENMTAINKIPTVYLIQQYVNDACSASTGDSCTIKAVVLRDNNVL